MKLIFLLLFMFVTSITMAQNSNTTQADAAITNAQNLYHQTIATKENIYNGQEYFHLNKKLNGHVFWSENVFLNGQVSYAGIIYPNRLLKLDILNDELVTQGANTSIQIKINKEKIDSFSIGNTRFERLQHFHKLPEGFYEILHDAKFKVICRRVKSIKEVVKEDGVDFNIVQKNTYYLLDNGVYKEIKNRQILFDFFKDKREEVKDYIRKEDLSFNKEPESFIVLSIKYYEQITN